MEEAAKRRLEAAGIDVDDALGRFLQNEALMMKFLGRFPADTSFPGCREAMARGDAAQAFEAAHTLKGVAGNLSLKRLYEALTPMVEELRAGISPRRPPVWMRRSCGTAGWWKPLPGCPDAKAESNKVLMGKAAERRRRKAVSLRQTDCYDRQAAEGFGAEAPEPFAAFFVSGRRGACPSPSLPDAKHGLGGEPVNEVLRQEKRNI